jgi:hypothetical protein
MEDITDEDFVDVPPYQYSSLANSTSIRIFYPMTCDAAHRMICGVFLPLDLAADNVPYYEALSYTWGPAVYGQAENELDQPWHVFICELPQEEDECVSEENIQWSHLPIGNNAASYLKAFISRQEQLGLDPCCYVWIDAICINQDDADERSVQIALMGKLYFQAAKVIAWMGESRSDWTDFKWMNSDVLMQLTKLVNTTPQGRAIVSAGSDPLDPTFWMTNFPSLEPPGGSWERVWESYWRFLNERRWFRRVWTYQEALLAQELIVCCGDDFDGLPIEVVGCLASIMHRAGWIAMFEARFSEWSKNNPCHHMMNLWKQRIQVMDSLSSHDHSSQPSATLSKEQWLGLWTSSCMELASRDAEFQVDKVNATLGFATLLRPSDVPESIFVRPAHWSARDAYTWMSSVFLEQAGSPRFLSFVSPPAAKRIITLPSWAADFSVGLRCSPLVVDMGQGYPTTESFNAGKPLERVSHTELAIHGSRFVIDGSRVAYFRPVHICKLEDLQESYLNLVLDLPKVYAATSEPGPKAVWRMLVWDWTGANASAEKHWGREMAQWIEARYIMGYLLPDHPDHARNFPFGQLSHDDWWARSEELLRRAMAADIWDDDNPAPSLDRIQASIEEIKQNPAWSDKPAEGVGEVQSGAAWLSFYDRVSAAIPKFKEVQYQCNWGELPLRLARTFFNKLAFLTESGHLGMCSMEAMDSGLADPTTDAEIWILRRGPVPYVLKPRSGLNDHFTYLGDCYIHGIMFGEWWPASEEARLDSTSHEREKSSTVSALEKISLVLSRNLSRLNTELETDDEATVASISKPREEVLSERNALQKMVLHTNQILARASRKIPSEKVPQLEPQTQDERPSLPKKYGADAQSEETVEERSIPVKSITIL